MSTPDPHRYDAILNLPHPTSKKHPRMSALNRAAQFAPFAALVGYEAQVEEAGRQTTARTEPDEQMQEKLNRTLQLLRGQLRDDSLHELPEAEITCFVPDERKDGGSYQTVVGRVKKFMDFPNRILLDSGEEILLDRISDVGLR